MPIIDSHPPQPAGLIQRYVAGNQRITDSFRLADLATFTNMLAGRRFHVLGSGGQSIGVQIAGPSQIATTRFHTSPNCGGVEVMMVVGRGNSNTVFGNFAWTLSDGAGAANIVTTATHRVGGSTAATAGPNEITVERIRIVDAAGAELAGDTEYTLSITGVSINLSILSFMIYEVPRTTLDTSTHTAISPDVFGVGSPILDRDVADIVDALWTIYTRQGVSQIYWSDLTGNNPSTTGTTWVNILDASTAGYSANAAGFWTIPYNKGRLVTSGTVDVKLWAIANVTPGGTAEVRFTGSGGLIGTVTGMTTEGATGVASSTATATLDTTLTSDLVVVEYRNSLAANGASLRACGMYEIV
jgi:hypothetical protein